MFDLTKPWPLGLNRQNWPGYLNVVLVTLFILLFVDVWVSQSMIAMPAVWRAPFFFITNFGLSDWILIPTLIAFIIAALAYLALKPGLMRRAAYEIRMIAGFVFLAVGAPGLVANLLKRFFGRGRPALFDDVGAFDFQRILNDWTYQSFPSGHSTTALAFAFVVGFMAPRFFGLFLLIGVMTGISRIAVGDHYPTDVLGGFIVGTMGAYLVRNYFARQRWLFANTPDGRVRFRGLPALSRLWRNWRQRARA